MRRPVFLATEAGIEWAGESGCGTSRQLRHRSTSDAFGAKRKLTEPRFTKSEFMNTRPVSTSARRAGRNNGHGLCLLHVGPPGTGTVGGKPNAKTAEVFASLKFSAVAAG